MTDAEPPPFSVEKNDDALIATDALSPAIQALFDQHLGISAVLIALCTCFQDALLAAGADPRIIRRDTKRLQKKFVKRGYDRREAARAGQALAGEIDQLTERDIAHSAIAWSLAAAIVRIARAVMDGQGNEVERLANGLIERLNLIERRKETLD